MGSVICSPSEVEQEKVKKPTPLLLHFREKIGGVVEINPLCSDDRTYLCQTQTPQGDVQDYDTD